MSNDTHLRESVSRGGRISIVVLLVEPQTPTKEDDTEHTDEKNECATGHLIDGDGCVKKPNVHQLKPTSVSWASAE